MVLEIVTCVKLQQKAKYLKRRKLRMAEETYTGRSNLSSIALKINLATKNSLLYFLQANLLIH